MANIHTNTDIMNGKKGESWILKWEHEHGSPKLQREIILRRNITPDVLNGKKPFKYIKDGKKEEIIDITKIQGLEWEKSSMPRLKQSSSPTFEHQTTIKPINKGKTNTLPPISPSTSNQRLPKLFSSSQNNKEDISLPKIKSESKSKGGFRKTNRKKQNKMRKTRRGCPQ